jgi:trk system potassium uptake protein
MNWKQILRLSGTMQSIMGLFMVVPTLIAAFNREWDAFAAFVITLAIILVYVTLILTIGKRWPARSLGIRDVYLFVTITWVVASALGALPLHITGATKDYASAYMEIMSGFTTTGLTTLSNIEALPKSLLFWRSLTHWIGGMGIVVLFVALLPLIGVEGTQLFSAEAVGPTKSKLTPKIKNTALILWLIYIVLTLVEVILLIIARLSPFDAFTVAFGTMATGGFAVKNASIAAYDSAFVDVVVTIFMMLAGVNFSLYFALIRKKISGVYHDTELRVYLGIFLFATIVSTLSLRISGTYSTIGESLRYASFHMASIMTTTGFAAADYGLWPALPQAFLLALMFIGGCAGSTGGGIKVTRIVTMVKLSGQNIRTLLHPKGVFMLQSEHEKIAWRTVNSIAGFIIIYIMLVLASTLVVASAGFDLLTALSSGLISVGNIGLGLGGVGPSGAGFGPMPAYVKWFLSLMMLAGRLEIYTVFAIFTRSFWKR